MFLEKIIAKNHNQNLIKTWLNVALTSFALGGFFSILLVFLRLPWAKTAHLPFADFFKTSLVIHVDLTILIWLMSIICLLFSAIFLPKFVTYGKFTAKAAFAGMLLIAISPFMAEGNPLMNNYIPILQNKIFLLGLTIFATCILANSVMVLFSAFLNEKTEILDKIITSTAMMIICCFVSFYFAYSDLEKFFLNNPFDPIYYYEMLFWGGGHLMQFVYVQILMLIWCLIAGQFGKMIKSMFILNFLFTIFAPLIYFKFSSLDGENLEFFTNHMIMFGGIAPVIVAFMLICSKADLKQRTPEMACFWGSFILFFAGGFIAILISGSNSTIPAHYHGSTVGISLAFMGLVYAILPQIRHDQKLVKWGKIQGFLYCFGQLMHISGLAWSGGYGALRKTPGLSGTAQAKFGLGLMGLGGLLAIIGGLIFVIICFSAIRRKSSEC